MAPKSMVLQYYQPALLPEQHKSLLETIDTLIEFREYIGVNKIALIAIEFYYELTHLTAKAVILELIDQGINPFDSTGACIKDFDHSQAKISGERGIWLESKSIY